MQHRFPCILHSSAARGTLTAVAAFLFGVSFLATAQAQTTYRWVDPATGRTVISDMPPPPAIKKVEISRGGYVEQVDKAAASTTNNAPAASTSYAVRQVAAKYPVTLYTSVNCGATCQTGRDLLNKRGIPFTEKVLQTTEEIDAFRKATGSDSPMLPTVLVGKEVSRGFESGAWNSLLDMAGYPKTAPYGSKPVPMPVVTPAIPDKPPAAPGKAESADAAPAPASDAVVPR